MSDSLWPHESQHARPPYPSPITRVHPDSHPSSQWCHSAISSSVAPSPPALSLSHYQGLFQWIRSLNQVAKVLELQLQHQSFQWIQGWFPLGWLVGSPCCARDSQESSPAWRFESKVLPCSVFFMVQLSHPSITTGKTIALTRWTFVNKIMSVF